MTALVEDRMCKSPAITTPPVQEWDRLLAPINPHTRLRLPPSPMRMFFMELRHLVISSIARFFSDGTSNRAILSRTERTRSCGVFGLLERLKRNAMLLTSLVLYSCL